jgi:hypothetical protein
MRHLTRPQQRVSGEENMADASNLNQKLALQNVKPFILVKVHVQGCPANRMHHLLRDK